MNLDQPKTLATGFTSRSLARAIFKAELPEAIIRSLPAQSLYMAAKESGLESAIEIIEMVTPEQGRLMLDLDLWAKDEFEEDNFWVWLALTDANSDLKILQKITKWIDLKIVALVIGRHVTHHINDEPSQVPPQEGCYTPDKGYTWVKIDTKDETKDFLLARLLALLFETSADLFYQLLSVSSNNSASVLTEEAYQDKLRRLAGEAIPDHEHATELNSPLPIGDALQELSRRQERARVTDVPIIEPLLFDHLAVEPLSSAMAEIGRQEDLEAELSLVMNAAIVWHAVPYYEQEEVSRLAAKVKGAINIGLELLVKAGQADSAAAIRSLGLGKLYRLGKGPLREFHTLGRKVKDETAREIVEDNVLFLIVAGAKEGFPEAPACLSRAGAVLHDEAGKLAKGHRPIEHLDELELLIEKLRGLKP